MHIQSIAQCFCDYTHLVKGSDIKIGDVWVELHSPNDESISANFFIKLPLTVKSFPEDIKFLADVVDTFHMKEDMNNDPYVTMAIPYGDVSETAEMLSAMACQLQSNFHLIDHLVHFHLVDPTTAIQILHDFQHIFDSYKKKSEEHDY